eukprot:sb/3469824/
MITCENSVSETVQEKQPCPMITSSDFPILQPKSVALKSVKTAKPPRKSKPKSTLPKAQYPPKNKQRPTNCPQPKPTTLGKQKATSSQPVKPGPTEEERKAQVSAKIMAALLKPVKKKPSEKKVKGPKSKKEPAAKTKDSEKEPATKTVTETTSEEYERLTAESTRKLTEMADMVITIEAERDEVQTEYDTFKTKHLIQSDSPRLLFESSSGTITGAHSPS